MTLCSITYLQTTIIEALNFKYFSCFSFCWAQNQCNFRDSALLIFITMQKITKLNLFPFSFILISNLSNYLFFYQYFFYHWFNCNAVRLSKSSFVFIFIFIYVTSNINIYVKINLHLLHLSRYDYCIYTCTHKSVCKYNNHWCRLTLYSIDEQ